jgi:hypothetical protein
MCRLDFETQCDNIRHNFMHPSAVESCGSMKCECPHINTNKSVDFMAKKLIILNRSRDGSQQILTTQIPWIKCTYFSVVLSYDK